MNARQTYLRRIDPSRYEQGEPFVVLRVGEVYADDGKRLKGNVTDVQQLHEMVTYFERYQKPAGDFPLIDFEHKGVGPLATLLPADISERLPLGIVADMRVEGDGLVVTPAWTKRGRRLVDAAEGLWHPSAAYNIGDIHDRGTGERIAGARLMGFSVTNQPATRPDTLGAVRSGATATAHDEAANRSVSSIDNNGPQSFELATMEDRMTLQDLLTAIAGLSEEDKAKAREALGTPAADGDAEQRAQQLEEENTELRGVNATLAGQIKTLDGRINAIEADRRVNARNAALSGLTPAMRGAAGALFDQADSPEAGAELVKRHFAEHQVDTSTIGEDGGAAGGSQPNTPPSDRRGFDNYVRSNKQDGEGVKDAMQRIASKFPQQYRAAYARKEA